MSTTRSNFVTNITSTVENAVESRNRIESAAGAWKLFGNDLLLKLIYVAQISLGFINLHSRLKPRVAVSNGPNSFFRWYHANRQQTLFEKIPDQYGK